MRRWEIQDAFGLDHAALVEVLEPGPPGPGEALVEMRAWSLNYRDQLMIEGSYDPRLAFPWVPLSDGAGEVVAVGEGVERVAVGDQVCPTFSPSWIAGAPDRTAVRRTRGGPIPGVLAERLCLPAGELVRVPASLSPAEAATLPCAGLTAHSALALAEVGPSDTVLVLGSGGVSVWALQLAMARGARVVATTSRPAKVEALRALGAAHVVRYDEDERWGRTVRKWSGEGVDCVIEIGGAGTLEQSLQAVRVGGTIALIGILAGAAAPLSLLPVLMNQIRCQGVFVGHRQGLEALVRTVAQHAIRPVIDQTFAFEELPRAVRYAASGQAVGKVVLTRATGSSGAPAPTA